MRYFFIVVGIVLIGSVVESVSAQTHQALRAALLYGGHTEQQNSGVDLRTASRGDSSGFGIVVGGLLGATVGTVAGGLIGGNIGADQEASFAGVVYGALVGAYTLNSLAIPLGVRAGSGHKEVGPLVRGILITGLVGLSGFGLGYAADSAEIWLVVPLMQVVAAGVNESYAR